MEQLRNLFLIPISSQVDTPRTVKLTNREEKQLKSLENSNSATIALLITGERRRLNLIEFQVIKQGRMNKLRERHKRES